jgi:hypothetical protein
LPQVVLNIWLLQVVAVVGLILAAVVVPGGF